MKYIKRTVHFFISTLSALYKKLLLVLPVKNRVFFYSIRSDGELKDNCALVSDALDCPKKVFAKMLPHPSSYVPKVFYYMLTSRVIVTDDYVRYLRSVRLRPGQKVVQLWHAGGAFKRFGLDAPSVLTEQEERSTHSQYTDVSVTAEYVRRFYADAFGIEIDKVKALGSPRTDIFFDEEKINEMRRRVFTSYPELKNKRLYVYFPTFREIEGVRVVYDPKINWSALDRELNDDELFIISRHPSVDYEFIGRGEFTKIKDYTDIPTTQLIAVSDVVVTDYSSVIFDSSLLGKPSVFYCPDEEEYERDFYLDYPGDLPGPVIRDGSFLVIALREAVQNPPVDKINEFIKKEMSACDGHSTERIAKLIMSYIEAPSR